MYSYNDDSYELSTASSRNDVRRRRTQEEEYQYSRGILPSTGATSNRNQGQQRFTKSHVYGRSYDDGQGDNEVLLNNMSNSETAPPIPPKDHHRQYRGYPSEQMTWTERYEQEAVPERVVPDAFYSDEVVQDDRNRYSRQYQQYHQYSKPLPIVTGPDELPPLPEEAAAANNKGRGHGIFGKGQKKPISWATLPYFVYCMSIIQICVFIYELARMSELTGSAFQTKPSFNPMLGPSSYVQTNLGSRFTPCMHYIAGITDETDLMFPCPNSTTTDTNVCSLSELCGMGGINPAGSTPKQWWRFITPIFIHAGFIHIGFNLILQLTLGARLEREIGILRFAIIYLSSGIAGFILGGNFSSDGISSCGCSGALFGVIAIDLLDLLFNWQLFQRPVFQLMSHIIEIIISFVLGLLPGLDNFSHIGGFAMGLLTGILLLRSPLKIRLVAVPSPEGSTGTNTAFDHQRSEPRTAPTRLQLVEFSWKNPSQGLRGRSKWWYAWLCVRLASFALIVVYFVMLIRNFENGGGHCSWCKYLSCLPVNGWCNQGDITTTTTTTN